MSSVKWTRSNILMLVILSWFALTGHLKWKGTLMGALLEMEVWSALMTLVWPVPKVQGGSAEITSSGCLRQILKNIWQSLCLLQIRWAVWNEWIFNSNTPEEKTCNNRQRALSDGLCVDTLWGSNYLTNISKLTTSTKAKANKYLRCKCAMSSLRVCFPVLGGCLRSSCVIMLF